jgi:glycosyltransferase involved in cell wall biosynthesis
MLDLFLWKRTASVVVSRKGLPCVLFPHVTCPTCPIVERFLFLFSVVVPVMASVSSSSTAVAPPSVPAGVPSVQAPKDHPTLVLNMIVKNEERTIGRLIESLAGLVDAYVICDTGSTDKTVETIYACFAKYPHIRGKVIHIPFKNFGYNRTEALKATAGWGDYALLVDADMRVHARPDFDKRQLTDNAYMINQVDGNIEYLIPRLVRTDPKYGFKYDGYTHENLNVGVNSARRFDGIWITHIGDGGCKGDKSERDLRLLHQQLKDGHCVDRSYFYIANTHWDLRNFDEAIKYYLKRIEAGGWYEEVWYSHYRIGLCYKGMNKIPEAIHWWLKAYQYHVGRAENIYEIAKYYQENSQYKLAMQFIEWGKKMTLAEQDCLFIETAVYKWAFDWLQSIAAMYLPAPHPEILHIYKKLLGEPSAPQDLLKSNMQFYKRAIAPCMQEILPLEDTYTAEPGFRASTPSLVRVKDGTYIGNIRLHNYDVTQQGQYINGPQITTFNKFIHLDSKFARLEEAVFVEESTSNVYKGVEDVRLFVDPADASGTKILFAGNTNATNQGMRVSVGEFRAPAHPDKLMPVELAPLDNRACEKNWVMFPATVTSTVDAPSSMKPVTVTTHETQMITDWFPMRVGKVNMETKTLEVVQVKQTPFLFSHFRGSTNGCLFGDELFFVVHLVHHASPRHYWHLLVCLDPVTLDVKRVSNPWTFESQAIEYCLGCIVEETRVIMTYSVWDKAPKIGIYHKDKLMEQIFRDPSAPTAPTKPVPLSKGALKRQQIKRKKAAAAAQASGSSSSASSSTDSGSPAEAAEDDEDDAEVETTAAA